mmetsp:Transcript_39663/g.39245  ORF Transcript_39663/g.39245 Transcript_39663/m.39245 type:complete len:432 (-) Transcript_39663:18-1313(-)
MCHTPKKNYFTKFIGEPLPVESNLEEHIHEAINAELAGGNLSSLQDIIDWITWSFMYRRLAQNPNYYNLNGKTGEDINEHLSELIENTVRDLIESKCIEQKDDDTLIIDNLGRIAAYYNIKHTTIQVFDENLSETRKIKGLLGILSCAEEFENLPMRDSDEGQLRALDRYIDYPVDPEDGIYLFPRVKTNILLQCHFERKNLSIDLGLDQKEILEKSLKLVHALVDIIATYSWFTPCLYMMRLSQMIVQGCSAKDSNLYQIPHFDYDLVERCKSSGIEDIGDLLEMEDEPREKLLNLTQKQLKEVAQVCNKIPSYEIEASVLEFDPDSGDVIVNVNIQGDDEAEGEEDEEEEGDSIVYAPRYPKEKLEQWWIIIVDPRDRKLLSIKRTDVKKNHNVKIQFTLSDSGNRDYEAQIICDSYIGCDESVSFSVE